MESYCFMGSEFLLGTMKRFGYRECMKLSTYEWLNNKYYAMHILSQFLKS